MKRFVCIFVSIVFVGCGPENRDLPAASGAMSATQSALATNRGNCPPLPSAPVNVGSTEEVDRMRQDIDRALDCDISSNVSAPAYLDDLNAAKALLAGVRKRQEEEGGRLNAALATQQDATVRALKKSIESTASTEKVKLADTRYTAEKVVAQVVLHEDELEQAKKDFVAISLRYKTYREQEGTILEHLRSIVGAGSTADFQQLAELRAELVQLAREESFSASGMVVDARRLAADMRWLVDALNTALIDYKDFLKENNFPMPDRMNEPIEALGKMVAYAEQRAERVVAATTKVSNQLTRRGEALVAIRSEAATRETLRQAGFMRASARYLEEVTARVDRLWRLPPKSDVLKLPLYSNVYAEHIAFLQLEIPCSVTGRPDWMDVGCRMMEGEFPKIRKFLSRTLPFTLRINTGTMRRAGVSGVLLGEIEEALTAGNLDAAVLSYDLAVRASDGSRAP